MKKTTKKLELKKSTVRILQPSALSGVGGGGLSNANTDCSGSCSTCDGCSDNETVCECASVMNMCHNY